MRARCFSSHARFERSPLLYTIGIFVVRVPPEAKDSLVFQRHFFNTASKECEKWLLHDEDNVEVSRGSEVYLCAKKGHPKGEL